MGGGGAGIVFIQSWNNNGGKNGGTVFRWPVFGGFTIFRNNRKLAHIFIHILWTSIDGELFFIRIGEVVLKQLLVKITLIISLISIL